MAPQTSVPPKNDGDLPFDDEEDHPGGARDQESGDAGDAKVDFVPRERKNKNIISGLENALLRPLSPPDIPSDLSQLSGEAVTSLAHELADFMDGDPPHPELQPDLDRLTAELAARQGAHR